MGVRISFDALRLCLLVAAGVTSGYLWRAAFESSSPAEERVAANPAIVEKAPAPPVVRIVPHHLTRNPPGVSTRAVRHVVVGPTRTAATGLISSHVASPPSSSPQPESPPPPPPAKPTPAPTPAPAPPPTTTTSPPPQTPSPPPPVVAAPVQQAVAPPAAPTTQTPPTTPGASGDGSRPGWGKGDDNHDHTGPGGGDKGK
jgi:hypothetical protein